MILFDCVLCVTLVKKTIFAIHIQVRLAKKKDTGEVVAIKKMKKAEMLRREQVAHIRAERDALAVANNPWIVELYYSFQDDEFLYLVMEYLAGGMLRYGGDDRMTSVL